MLDFSEIKELIKKANDQTSRHTFYEQSVKIAKDIKETFSESYPPFLDIIRPKEAKKDSEYRKTVFENPVIGDKNRILDKFIKVEQSEDFLVNYPQSSTSNNPLEDYCENGFNGHGNLINWTFSIGIKNYAEDPNSVCVVLDKNPPQRQTDNYKPYPYIFNSSDVLFFERNKLCVVVEKDTIDFNKNIYYIIDEVNYWIFREEDNINKIQVEYIGPIPHFCGEMPAFKLGKHIKEENSKGEILYNSILTFPLPHFKKAIARSSDLDIELNHHINTLEWRMAPKKCPTCKGKKTVVLSNGTETCSTCSGKGTLNWGPLDVLEVDMFEDKFLDGQKSFPFNSPGGFVQRNIDAIREIDNFYTKHIDNAYDSIDFGILRKKDINSAESGLSKQYNRLEFSQRIYSEGRHIIENILIKIYTFIDAQLFGINPTNLSNKRIPDITIPISFDVMSPEMVLEEIKKAKDAGASPEIMGALQKKYCDLVFGINARETQTLTDEINLNPAFGRTADEILTLYGAGSGSNLNGMNQTSFVIASNWKGYIDRAMRENANWNQLDEIQKWDIFVGYANEQINLIPSVPTLPIIEVV